MMLVAFFDFMDRAKHEQNIGSEVGVVNACIALLFIRGIYQLLASIHETFVETLFQSFIFETKCGCDREGKFQVEMALAIGSDVKGWIGATDTIICDDAGIMEEGSEYFEEF